MKAAAALAILIALAIPWSASAQEARAGCTREVSEVLQSVGLSDNNIRRKQDLRQFVGGSRRRVSGLHIWVWPRDCDGRFIIYLDRICRVTNTYTMGECRFEGHDHVE